MAKIILDPSEEVTVYVSGTFIGVCSHRTFFTLEREYGDGNMAYSSVGAYLENFQGAIFADLNDVVISAHGMVDKCILMDVYIATDAENADFQINLYQQRVIRPWDIPENEAAFEAAQMVEDDSGNEPPKISSEVEEEGSYDRRNTLH